jgi:hypothetical protein
MWFMDDTVYEGIANTLRIPGRKGERGVWIMFLTDDGPPGVTLELPPAAELRPTEYDALAAMIEGTGASVAIIALPRSDSEPLPDDWSMWHAIQARLANSDCEIDLLVIDEQSWWSASGGRRRHAVGP